MLRLFHIVLVLGNRVKILKLPLYSIQFLHQITTSCLCGWNANMLYSIQFLHQITTPEMRTNSSELLYSIQFLHQITTSAGQAGLLVELYSIQFLHQITTSYCEWIFAVCCIVSNFYIKSQLVLVVNCEDFRCIVSNFYIKSQRRGASENDAPVV